jgi:D-alanine-D-alanine ligase
MKVAVLFGGTSSERDVSIASGIQVAKALREAGHEVVAVDISRGMLDAKEQDRLLRSGVAPAPPKEEDLAVVSINMVLLTKSEGLKNVDIVFLALHGGTGEDGTIQAFFDLADMPYTGSGHAGSAAAMDKDLSKRLFRFAGIPTPNWIMAPAASDAVGQDLGYPVVVKSNSQGSSVGLYIVKESENLKAAIDSAFQCDDEVMIEEFIAGREFTVGILNDRALAVGEIIPQKSDIFDYESKYQEGGAKEIFPADLTEEKTRLLQELALKAHRALKLDDYSRVDFRMDDQGNFWCLEVNTLPGMTAMSLLPKSAAAVGINFTELCEHICRLAIDRHMKKSKREHLNRPIEGKK